MASPVRLDRARLEGWVQRVAALPDPVPESFVRELEGAATFEPLPPAFLDGLVAEGVRMPARVWRAALEGLLAFDDAATLGDIRAPTVLVWGDRDAIVGREEQEALASAIPGSRLVILSDVGHSPHWERPDAVARAIADLQNETA